MNDAFMFALVSAFGYGVTTIIYKAASRSIDPLTLSLVVSGATTLTLALTWFFGKWHGWATFSDERGFLIASSGGVIAGISLAAYVLSIAWGDAGMASTVRNLSFLVTFVLSVLLFAESLTWSKVVGVIAAIISLFLLSK